ncbi:MAG: cohesin domain-containing protein, partial [Candidatus Zixiibacteriota bacterium]
MIKHARHSFVLLAVIALTALIAASCSDNGTRATFDRAGVRITMEKTSLAAEAASVELEVRMVANDSLVHEATAEVVDGQFGFAPFGLPAGEAEFIARALDSEGGLLYAGSVVTTIIGGASNDIELTLVPAVPMVRIAPYITDANTEAPHECYLELHNLSAFAAGTFVLMYDSDLLSFTSAAPASTAWGTLTISPSPSNFGMQLSVTRSPNAGDAIPAGVVRLARLTFDPLIAGRAQIDVSVSRLINAAGQSIPELTTL